APSPELEAPRGRGRGAAGGKFRIGIRRGENEIVLKVVFAGGARPGGPGGPGAFTFNLTPEGDDVLSHGVATALRLEALELIRGTSPTAATPAAQPGGLVGKLGKADATKPELKKDEPKKVSLVGEKSAPLKPEEENKLSPSQRRRKVLREYFRSRIDPVGRL